MIEPNCTSIQFGFIIIIFNYFEEKSLKKPGPTLYFYIQSQVQPGPKNVYEKKPRSGPE